MAVVDGRRNCDPVFPFAYEVSMGWRTQDAYERDAEERRRALPWWQRYNWPGVLLFALIVAALGTIILR